MAPDFEQLLLKAQERISKELNSHHRSLRRLTTEAGFGALGLAGIGAAYLISHGTDDVFYKLPGIDLPENVEGGQPGFKKRRMLLWSGKGVRSHFQRDPELKERGIRTITEVSLFRGLLYFQELRGIDRTQPALNYDAFVGKNRLLLTEDGKLKSDNNTANTIL